MGTGNTLYTSNYFFSTFVILLSFIGGGVQIIKQVDKKDDIIFIFVVTDLFFA